MASKNFNLSAGVFSGGSFGDFLDFLGVFLDFFADFFFAFGRLDDFDEGRRDDFLVVFFFGFPFFVDFPFLVDFFCGVFLVEFFLVVFALVDFCCCPKAELFDSMELMNPLSTTGAASVTVSITVNSRRGSRGIVIVVILGMEKRSQTRFSHDN